MKRTITAAAAMFLVFAANAEIKTEVFENFEGESMVFERMNYEGTGSEIIGIEENPQKSGINPSDKCLALTLTKDHQWWHKINLIPGEGEAFVPTSDQHVYLHFKMMRSRVIDASEIHVFENASGENCGHVQMQFNNSAANLWEDFIIDLTEYFQTAKQIERILIQPALAWNGVDSEIKYYIDDIKLLTTSYPDGAKIYEVTDLANYEEGTTASGVFNDPVLFDGNATVAVVDNPKKEVNETAKVLSYNKPAATVWWYACQLPVKNGLIKAEYPNNYLHMMMYTGGNNVRVIVKDHMGNSVRSEYSPYDATVWEDFVFDISELKGESVSAIELLFGFNGEDNWNNPAGTFYVDELVINDSIDMREKVSTSGVENVANDSANVSVVANGGNITIAGEVASAKVYNAAGIQVAELNAAGSIVLPANLYIVTVVTTDGGTVVKKVVNF